MPWSSSMINDSRTHGVHPERVGTTNPCATLGTCVALDAAPPRTLLFASTPPCRLPRPQVLKLLPGPHGELLVALRPSAPFGPFMASPCTSLRACASTRAPGLTVQLTSRSKVHSQPLFSRCSARSASQSPARGSLRLHHSRSGVRVYRTPHAAPLGLVGLTAPPVRAPQSSGWIGSQLASPPDTPHSPARRHQLTFLESPWLAAVCHTPVCMLEGTPSCWHRSSR